MANFSKPDGINIIWATNGTKTDPGEAKSNTGWVVELPPYQTANYIDWKQDSFIAHINQHGVPLWDATTEYQGNTSYVQGSNGIIYKCSTTNTNKDPSNTLNSAYWAQAFETYGSVALVTAALNAHLANYATLAGIGNVAAARVNLQVYSRSESDTRYAALLGSASNNFSVATATLPDHAVPLSQFSSLFTQATETTAGVMKLATNSLAAAGADDLTAMTPLKTANTYLSKAGNLAGLGNAATARSNLGLGTMAVETATSFLRASNSLSDVVSVSAARANLGLTSTAIQPETYFLRAAQNLADVASAATARTNLGLTSTAVTALSTLMLKADNLAGLTNLATARANLGLGTAATANSNQFLQVGNNLADLSNGQAARNNLGLGSAATMNATGTTGTLDFTSSWDGSSGWHRLPNGLVEAYVSSGPLAAGSYTVLNLPIAFSSIINIQTSGVYLQGVGNIEIAVFNAGYTASSVTVYVRRWEGSDSGVYPDRVSAHVRVLGRM